MSTPINRWADDCDDSSDGEDQNDHVVTERPDIPVPGSAPVQILQPIKSPEIVATVPTPVVDPFHEEEQDDDKEHEDMEEEDDDEDDDDDDEEEVRQKRLLAAKELAKAKAEQQAKKTSVKDQLENLDDILNEFGIDVVEDEQEEDDNEDNEEDDKAGDAGNGNNANKKRRKKKKKNVTPATDAQPVDDAPVDVSAVIKAKTKKKGTPSTSEAAATAAKEQKAKQDGKKKKKRGDNMQFGR